MPKQPSTPWDEVIERLKALPRPGIEDEKNLVAVVGAREGWRLAQARTAALVALVERLVACGFPSVKSERRELVVILEEAQTVLAAYRKGE